MKTLDIAKKTYHEMFHSRIVLVLLFVAVLFLFLLNRFFMRGNPLIDFYIFNRPKTVLLELKMGLNIILMIVMLLAIDLPARIFSENGMREDLKLILVRPVSRLSFLAGRIFGVYAILLSFMLILAFVFVGMIFFDTGELHCNLFFQVLLLQVNVITITALVALFSLLVSPFAGSLAGMGVYFLNFLLHFRFPIVIGSFFGWIHSPQEHPVYFTFYDVFEYLLPPFSTLTYLVKDDSLDVVQYGLNMLRMGGWFVFYFILTYISFQERDIL